LLVKKNVLLCLIKIKKFAPPEEDKGNILEKKVINYHKIVTNGTKILPVKNTQLLKTPNR
jgi:hypothetical protein